MSDSPNTPKDFDPKDFSYEPTAEEKKTERLNRLLASVEMGWKISIIREQPTWCRGHLETFEVFDPSESVDIDYLIRTWGGQRLHLKVHDHRGQWVGGGSISLYSYPPKVQGAEITQKDVFGHAPMQQSMPVIPVQQSGFGQTQQIDIAKLFQLLQTGKKSELDLALKILDRAPQTVQPQQTVQPMGSMIADMAAMLQMFGQMRELFGTGEHFARSDDDSLTPVIGDVIKALFENRQNQGQNPTVKPALVAPKIGPMPTKQPNHSVPDLRPVTGLGDSNLSQIADKLSSLSASDAVDVLMQALGNMPEKKRQEAMQTFFSEIMEDSNLDGSLNPMDTYDQDDEDDDPKSQDKGGAL